MRIVLKKQMSLRNILILNQLLMNMVRVTTFIMSWLNILNNEYPLSGVKLYPFSIKKGRNIYGIVFGSSHPRGVEKFLRTAWKENPENGEANFDIHNDELGTIDLFEGQKLSKIELFQSKFEKEVLNGRIRNNQQAFDFTLDKGHIPQHATDVMKRLKKENIVSYPGISPKISYDFCHKKNSIEIIEYRLIK